MQHNEISLIFAVGQQKKKREAVGGGGGGIESEGGGGRVLVVALSPSEVSLKELSKYSSRRWEGD